MFGRHGWIVSGCLLAIGACADGEDVTAPPLDSCTGTMSALIGSLTWSGSYNKRLTRFGDAISVIGTDPAQRSITVTVAASGSGTFPLGAGHPSQASAMFYSGGSVWAAGPSLGGGGSVTVDRINPLHANGSFSFDAVPITSIANNHATGTVTITNGVFDVTCQS